MWLSPLTVTPAKAREAKNAFDKLYFVANAHVYMAKEGAAPSLAYSLAGRLVGSKSGWIVLEVPMALVHGAFDALHEPGVEMPPAFSDYENYKAHISVMRPDEVEQIGGLDKITERGHFFHYTLGPIQTVEPAGWAEMSKVWFIKVKSPELEKLRKSYGLSARPKDNEFDFHITIGVRRKNVLRANDVAKAAAETKTMQTTPNYSHRIDDLHDYVVSTGKHPDTGNSVFMHSVVDASSRQTGRPIAYATFETVAKGLGEVRSLYVDPNHRGKGHGKLLWNKMQEIHPGMDFVTQPDPFGDEQTSVEDLHKIYTSYGFKPDAVPGWLRLSAKPTNLALPATAKTADDLAVSSISLTPDATDEAPKSFPETPHFPVLEKKPKQESEPDQGPTLPWASAALKVAADLNEKRGGKTSQKVSLPVIGHYEAKGKVGRNAFSYQDVYDDASGEHCDNCAYFCDEEKCCELFEELNKHFPSVFALKEEVKPKGYCNAHIARGQHFEEKEETQEAKTKTVAIDLDGTLAHYDGWKGEDVIGEMRPGAADVVKWLKKKGHKVVLWTTRGNTERLKKWLKENDISVDYINENPDQPPNTSAKIIAEIYVDDRSIDARKSWPEIKKELAERLGDDNA